MTEESNEIKNLDNIDSPDQAEVPAADEPKPERQKQTRHLRAPIEIRIEITRGPQSFNTTSVNLALGGVSFESMEEMQIGEECNILLYIPVNKELELLKIQSKVVWVEDQMGSWQMGAAFKKFAPGDFRRLKEWLIQSIRALAEGRTYF